jgi:hypothetical protein
MIYHLPRAGGDGRLPGRTITLANQLPNGSSINLQLLCGVQQDGGFRVFAFVEALP